MFLLVMKDTGLQFLPLCNVSDRDSVYSEVCQSKGGIHRPGLREFFFVLFFWSGLVCQIFTSCLEVGWVLHCLNGPALHCHSLSHHTGPGSKERHESFERTGFLCRLQKQILTYSLYASILSHFLL